MVWKSTGGDVDLAPLSSRSQAQVKNIRLVRKMGIADIGRIQDLLKALHSAQRQAAKASERSARTAENCLLEQTGAEKSAFQIDHERTVSN